LNKLLSFYKYCGIHPILLEDKKSIFDAYNYGYNYIKGLEEFDDFIVIFCHDDVEILSNREHFLNCLSVTQHYNRGFIGVAGSKRLTDNGMWWWSGNRRDNLLCGEAFHHDEIYPTPYGIHGEVAVLDGLFLAIHGEKLKNINLKKPDYFEGEWDYYDVIYCHRARVENNYQNITVPIQIRHHSSGELVGRDSWHKNKGAFVEGFVKNRKYGI